MRPWIAAVWLVCCVSVFQQRLNLRGVPVASVKVEPIEERLVAPQQSFVGEVVPAHRSIVGSAVDGRIIEMPVTDGTEVHMFESEDGSRPRGEPIAQLLTDTVSIEIAAAQGLLALRQQELNELKAGSARKRLHRPRRGWKRPSGFGFRQSGLRPRRRVVPPGPHRFPGGVRTITIPVPACRTGPSGGSSGLEMAVQGPRIEQIRQAEARLAMAQEEVHRLEDRREKHTIRTPFAGAVSVKRAEVGQWVSAGDAIAEIVQLDPIEIEVAVPEIFITTSPHSGAEIPVRLDSLPDREFLGR